MKGITKRNSRVSYLERELIRANERNDSLCEENKSLKAELSQTQSRLADAEAACRRITEAYEAYISEHAENIERLYEAQEAYDAARLELRRIMKEYSAEAKSWISEIRKTGKAV